MNLVRYGLVALLLCASHPLIQAADALEGRLTIFAATSLTDVFEAMRDEFSALRPEVEILLNFASSSTLAAQLSEGAPADVFASANERQMTLAVEAGRVDADAVAVFAHNQLMLIAPADNPAGIASVADLAGESILLVLSAPGTPIRAYTEAMLLSHDAELGAGFSEDALRNLASEERNVRQVVARVALGEADAGVVYQSDVRGDLGEALLPLPIDPRHNQLASYPIAPLADSAEAELAEAFVAFTLSAPAREILTAHGFCPPDILGRDAAEPARPLPTATAAKKAEPDRGACAREPEESLEGG